MVNADRDKSEQPAQAAADVRSDDELVRCPGCGFKTCRNQRLECAGEEELDEIEDGFVDAVLDRSVSNEVGLIGLSVGDVLAIARWLAPLASHLAAKDRRAAERALADERAKVARVEAVRQRVLDPTAHVTEGPLIGRIKVESWLRAALAGPEPETSDG